MTTSYNGVQMDPEAARLFGQTEAIQTKTEKLDFLGAQIMRLAAELTVQRDLANERARTLEHTQTHLATRSTERDALQSIINVAREACMEATMENGGCETGKREFLASTGLFNEDEIDEAFNPEVEVSVTVEIQSFTVRVDGLEMRRRDVRDGEYDDLEVDQNMVDDAVREFISNADVEWRIDSVREA